MLAEARREAREKAKEWTMEVKMESEDERERKAKKAASKKVRSEAASADEGAGNAIGEPKKKRRKLKKGVAVDAGEVDDDALFTGDEDGGDKPSKKVLCSLFSRRHGKADRLPSGQRNASFEMMTRKMRYLHLAKSSCQCTLSILFSILTWMYFPLTVKARSSSRTLMTKCLDLL